jgi:hypothetical protein
MDKLVIWSDPDSDVAVTILICDLCGYTEQHCEHTHNSWNKELT